MVILDPQNLLNVKVVSDAIPILNLQGWTTYLRMLLVMGTIRGSVAS